MTGSLAATGSNISGLIRLALLLLGAGVVLLGIVWSAFDKRDSE